MYKKLISQMTENSSQHISDVTLLITHYNRSESLKRLLTTIRNYNITFDEVIVSDDGSRPEHVRNLQSLQTEFGFTLIAAEVNKGLGNSINKGQDAVKSDFILYIQDDFVPKAAFIDALRDGLYIMKNEEQWDLVRFYSFPYSPYPYLKPYKMGFSEMKFSLMPWYSNHLKFHMYSDHPHLKRRTYTEKFGRYYEASNGDVTEMRMCRTFLKTGGKALYFKEYKNLFEHDNPEDEPGLFRPETEKTRSLANIAPLYWLYLRYKMVKDTILYILDK